MKPRPVSLLLHSTPLLISTIGGGGGVGALVGLGVGESDGAPVGAVGPAVGDTVGDSVGLHRTNLAQQSAATTKLQITIVTLQ